MPRTKLSKLSKTNQSSSQPQRWLSTQAIRALLDVSSDHLTRQVDNGSFKLGEHYLVTSHPNSTRRAHLWNYDAIVQLWATDPAVR